MPSSVYAGTGEGAAATAGPLGAATYSAAQKQAQAQAQKQAKEGVLQDEVRVLVVDDHLDVAESIAQLLQARGYTTRIARDGVEAMAALEAFDPDCMLLDLNMPHMSGAEVARAVRDRSGREIVLVAVSGRADLDIQSEDLDCVDHWLKKPVDFEAFYKIFPVVE